MPSSITPIHLIFILPYLNKALDTVTFSPIWVRNKPFFEPRLGGYFTVY